MLSISIRHTFCDVKSCFVSRYEDVEEAVDDMLFCAGGCGRGGNDVCIAAGIDYPLLELAK